MTSGEKKREVCVEHEGGGRRGTISDGRFVCPRQAHRALVQRVAGATGGGGLELGATARGHLGYHFGKPGDP